MDKIFLNKVVSQIVRETEIDYNGEMILPLSSFLPGPHSTSPFPPLYILFTQHCEEIYGLNKDETEYVWNEYKDIIRDKINNGL